MRYLRGEGEKLTTPIIHSYIIAHLLYKLRSSNLSLISLTPKRPTLDFSLPQNDARNIYIKESIIYNIGKSKYLNPILKIHTNLNQRLINKKKNTNTVGKRNL
jgi:hypothetical protein